MTQLNGVEQVGVEHAGGIGNAHAFEAFLQLGQLVDGLLHQLRRTVNAATFLHGQPHFVTDRRPLLIAFLIDQRLQALFNVGNLRIQRGAVGRASSSGARHGLFTCQTTKHHQLSQ
ncbi:hypothetical protein D3C75_1186860 [compost metagenome]